LHFSKDILVHIKEDKMVINAPSLANINLLDFGQQVRELYEAGVRFFHVDLMDGHYVNNLCFPTSVVKNLKERYPDCIVEVHLMVDNPMAYIETLKNYGADYVAFHCDSTSFVRRTITTIQNAGMKAGVVINPSQRIDIIEPYANLLDYVIFMAVEPGFAGQKFLPGSMERLAELARFRKEKGHSFKILIDGGVNYDIAAECVRNGADMLVTGIYMVFEQPDGIKGACRRFEETLKDVECCI